MLSNKYLHCGTIRGNKNHASCVLCFKKKLSKPFTWAHIDIRELCVYSSLTSILQQIKNKKPKTCRRWKKINCSNMDLQLYQSSLFIS